MKVVTSAKPARLGQSSYKSLTALLLAVSLISFASAWIVKGELVKRGGIRSAAHKWMQSRGNLALNREQSYLNYLKIPSYLLNPSDLPKLVVDIKFKHFQKLQKKRQQAIQKGLLITGKDDFVPAEIRHSGETTRVKLRLKGDLLDHIKGKKWSFRVKVKGKDHLFGMRVFSIQSPLVRGFQGGPLFYSTLQRYGVIAPRYKLIQLVVNGNNMGTMSIEEHFSKEMLEASGRKESVIIRFDESLVWDATDGRKHAGLGGHFDNYHVAEIDAFGSKKIAKSERLKNDFRVAAGLLRAFENGKLAPSKVFDTELMGRYMAVSELWGSWHSFSWRNLRYYYNPITAKLEPIGYDPDIQTRSRPGENNAKGEPITSVMRSALLNDPEIYTEFTKAIHLISEDMKSGSLISDMQHVQDTYLPALRKEFFFLQPFDQSELDKRLALLKNYKRIDLENLYQISHHHPKLIQAYLLNSIKNPQIELANITPSTVEVISIHWISNKGDKQSISVDTTTNLTLPLILPPMPQLGESESIIIQLSKLPVNAKDYHLEIIAKVHGTYKTENIEVEPYFNALTSNPVPESSLHKQASQHKDYLVVNSSNRTMTIKPGSWNVLTSIIVPKDSTLDIGAATTLLFSYNAGIISHGAVHIQGSDDAHVLLEGIDSSSWQGLTVINAAGKSALSNVEIRGAKGITESAWKLTGGVTFYKSNVAIKNSLIEDSRGEDALNIIHSNFVLDNVTLKNTLSDAFDADFSTGKVFGGLYQDIGLAGGGDAIDVSGSKITVEKTRFVNIDDKAISAGERSQVLATNLDINGAGTGAASKDDSKLEITASTIRNARVAGLMAYIKKPEYGPGHIISSAIKFGDGFEKTRAQKGSFISIDNKPVTETDFDVKELYKTVMKPGLRK